MATIKLLRDTDYAPCRSVIARQRDDGTFDTRDGDNTILVQTDLDLPAIACLRHAVGRSEVRPSRHERESGLSGVWNNSRNPHSHRGALAPEHIGATADDPGYFD